MASSDDSGMSDEDFKKLRAKAVARMDAYNEKMKGKDVGQAYVRKGDKVYGIDKSGGVNMDKPLTYNKKSGKYE